MVSKPALVMIFVGLVFASKLMKPPGHIRRLKHASTDRHPTSSNRFLSPVAFEINAMCGDPDPDLIGEPVELPNGSYKIYTCQEFAIAPEEKYLALKSDQDGVHFHIRKQSCGNYKIKHKHSRKCFSIENGDHSDTAKLVLERCNHSSIQKWRIYSTRNGGYSFENVQTGKFIDVSWRDFRLNNVLFQYMRNGTSAQRFYLLRNE